MDWNSRSIGFTLSALVHLLIGVLFLSLSSRSEIGMAKNAPVVLTLSMFEETPTAEAELPEPTAVKPLPASKEKVKVEKPTVTQHPKQTPAKRIPLKKVPVQKTVEARSLVAPSVHRPLQKPKATDTAPKEPKPVANKTKTRPVIVENLEPENLASKAPIDDEREATDSSRLIDERSSFLAQLTARVQNKKYYPRASRKRAEEGRVVVSFTINKDGSLINIDIKESSHFRRLDRAAIDALKKINPFIPIPAILGKEYWHLSLPIVFTLQG